MKNRFGFKFGYRLVAGLGLAILAVIPAFGAGGEVEGFGGGQTLDGGGGTHGVGGAEAGVKLGSAHIFGEFGFSTLASENFTTSTSTGTVNGNAKVNLATYGGGVDYGFGSSKVVPYALLSIGAWHLYGTGSSGGTSVSLSVTTATYATLGGGARIYLSKNFGIKPEIRYLHYGDSLVSGNSIYYTAGVFWQFGK